MPNDNIINSEHGHSPEQDVFKIKVIKMFNLDNRKLDVKGRLVYLRSLQDALADKLENSPYPSRQLKDHIKAIKAEIEMLEATE